jgi:hypothetical protein
MNNQPVAINVAIGGVISTGVALAALLWPDRLSPEMQVAIIAFANSVIVVAVILLTKSQVTPIADPTLKSGTSVKVEGTTDSVVIAATPPGPTGVEGGGVG